MMMKQRWLTFALLLALMPFAGLAMSSAPKTIAPDVRAQSTPRPTEAVEDENPHPGATPVPPSTPAPTATPGTQTIVSQIFHTMSFPAKTLSDALTGVFSDAVQEQAKDAQTQIANWNKAIVAIITPPRKNMYSEVAQGSLSVAAALAVPLFLLRLALYHWGRLSGSSDDNALRVVGDWILAAVLAVAAGIFLDLVVQMGWWMSAKILSAQTRELGAEFVKQMTASSLQEIATGGRPTLFGTFFETAFAIGALLSIVGILFAFMGATSALYLMAVVAPPIMIMGVIPQMGWIRSLWLKVIAILAMLPIIGGAIFRAALSSNSPVDGLLGTMIHLIWLWGAAGAMLSIAGILGRFTLTTAADAGKQILGGAVKIAGMATLAATGVGAVGAVGAGAAGSIGAAGGGAAGGVAGAIGSGGAGIPPGITGGANMTAASNATGAASVMGAIGQVAGQSGAGFRAAATLMQGRSFQYSLAARGEQIAAQEQHLQQRMADQEHRHANQIGMQAAQAFGSHDNFRSAYSEFSSLLPQGIDPELFLQSNPQEAMRLSSVYQENRMAIDASDDPQQTLGNLAGLPDWYTEIS